jgi:hypothetical protein
MFTTHFSKQLHMTEEMSLPYRSKSYRYQYYHHSTSSESSPMPNKYSIDRMKGHEKLTAVSSQPSAICCASPSVFMVLAILYLELSD